MRSPRSADSDQPIPAESTAATFPRPFLGTPAPVAGPRCSIALVPAPGLSQASAGRKRSEEHTSELQSRLHLVCRLLLEKKKKKKRYKHDLNKKYQKQLHINQKSQCVIC